MGLLRKLGIVIRSYLASAEQAIDHATEAEKELRETSARRKALEEVRALQEGTREALDGALLRPRTSPDVQRLAADYKLLGVPVGAELAAVEDAWRKLATRADPKRYPAGSDEERRAGHLLNSINEAYERIREALNPTEGRFGNLEL